MKKTFWLACSAPFLLASCDSINDRSNYFITDLPAEVLAIAAPHQDLTSVRIEPLDGCYVYLHVGPVETTLLPLTTMAGGRICTRQNDPTVSTPVGN